MHQPPISPDERILDRRAVASGIAALLLAGHVTGTSAQNPGEALEPNLYDLTGDGVSVSYATSSEAGAPLFVYTEGDTVFSASGYATDTGDGINIDEVAMVGTIVSMYLDSVADGWTRTLSLVLPEIHLTPGHDTFDTIAIITTHRMHIGGPAYIQGALQSYEVIPLAGTAAAVVF